jgi:hypothetical protein
MNQWLLIPSTPTLRRSIVALPLHGFLLVLKPTLQMCILSSPINSFVNTLLDNITQPGAPTKLISDRAQVEISEHVKQVLRPLHISTWQSEPHQQHQNPAERQYQNIKRLCNTILDRSGAPAYTWLLCLILTTVTFRLTHVRNADTSSVSANLSDTP